MVSASQVYSEVKNTPVWAQVVLITIGFLLYALMVFLPYTLSSSMSDPNNIRRYVVGSDGLSLDDRVNKRVSPLTGSRDVPVFFQDFDYDMKRDASGSLVTEREGLTGDKDPITDIEKRFLGA